MSAFKAPVVIRHLPYEPQQCAIKEESMKFRDWLLALIGLALMLGSFIVLWTGADSPNGEAFGQAVVWSLWMLAIGFFLLVMGIPSQRRKLKKFEDLLFRQEEN